MGRFIGENLDVVSLASSTPAEIAEAEEALRKATFGTNYKTNREGVPVDTSRGSDQFYTSDAELPADARAAARLKQAIRETFASHIRTVQLRSKTGTANPEKGPFFADADEERDRINGLRQRRGLEPLSI